jgi:hypothetical protein
LENQIVAVALTPIRHSRLPATEPVNVAGWVVAPAFDLLFLANIAWPILLLPDLSTESGTAVEFWQLYFLTLPHRWVTLFLVIADPDRREGQTSRLLLVALLAFLLVSGVWAFTGALTCLALLDYVWNGWHFAAQHHGVLRMYSRKVGGSPEWLERWGVRCFVTYAVLRTAGWTTGWLEASHPTLLRVLDGASLTLPATLLVAAVIQFDPRRLGRLIYLTSVCLLYSAIVLSLSLGWRRGVVALVTAASLFHAVEYFAVVTYYARRRRTIGRAGLFRKMASIWAPLLAIYLIALGSLGAMIESPSSPPVPLWMAANLWAAFVHYAFDGMIWKLRRPATAQALGV